jgi:hypothetical protein
MTNEERLAKMERELGRAKRRSRWLLVGLAVGLGALAFVWASAASVPRAEAQGAAGGRTVRANAFILEDEGGRVRASLHMDAGGPVLRLYDAAGQPRAGFGVSKLGPVLSLADAAGKHRATLTLGEDASMLALGDAADELLAVLEMGSDGSGLDLFDAAGKQIWSAP